MRRKSGVPGDRGKLPGWLDTGRTMLETCHLPPDLSTPDAAPISAVPLVDQWAEGLSSLIKGPTLGVMAP
jgi:hypothetical protein